MIPAFNTLCFMRHHGLGVREAMAFVVIDMYGIATARNIAEGMVISQRAANQLLARLRNKQIVERARFTRTIGTKHAVPRIEKVWQLANGISQEWSIVQATNKLPKWHKRPAKPRAGKAL